MHKNASVAVSVRRQLWGIFQSGDHPVAGDGRPPRTVIEASSQRAAEEEAARLGFEDPAAIAITAEQAATAEWLPNRRLGNRQELASAKRHAI